MTDSRRPPSARFQGGRKGLSGFNYRILVVDDEETILATSKAVLESQKYEVRTARNGFEALVELRRSTPDILITDCLA